MNITGRKTPCYGCDKRRLACHADCVLYSDFKEDLEKQKDYLQEEWYTPPWVNVNPDSRPTRGFVIKRGRIL